YVFFLPPPPPTTVYTLTLHDALPILWIQERHAAAQQPLRFLWRQDRGHQAHPLPPGRARAALSARGLQPDVVRGFAGDHGRPHRDRKSTRLNSSHVKISYAVFCLKKK